MKAIREPVQPIADAYQISRARVDQIEKHHGIKRRQWRNPDAVFAILLGHRACPLRTRLTDPAVRKAIRKNLTVKSP